MTCSAILNNIIINPDVFLPMFKWFYGSNGNAPLPSGVTTTDTTDVLNNHNYTSTLQISQLSQSHTGNYACRLGAGSLVNNVMITVNGGRITRVKYHLYPLKFSYPAPSITVMVTATLTTPLMVGQTSNTLTCNVFGVDRLTPTMAYQWTRNDGTTSESVGTNSNILPLTSVGLSDAREYTCHAIVNSNLLNNGISMSGNRIVIIQSELINPVYAI